MKESDERHYHLYSQHRRRYQKDGFNLDLSYITPQIIAMSFPESGLITLLKNNINDVETFLNTYHKDNYRVYNLTDSSYDQLNRFDNNYHQFAFEDHSAPQLYPAYQQIVKWNTYLQQSPNNVVAVHCKAGKGRTGTMICCLLLFQNQQLTADQVIQEFAQRRSYDGSAGVENPSQIRFVMTFEQMRNQQFSYITKYFKQQAKYSIQRVYFESSSMQEQFRDYTCNIIYYLQNNDSNCAKQQIALNLANSTNQICFMNTQHQTVLFSDDISIILQHKNKNRQIRIQFNTEFLNLFEFQYLKNNENIIIQPQQSKNGVRNENMIEITAYFEDLDIAGKVFSTNTKQQQKVLKFVLLKVVV